MPKSVAFSVAILAVAAIAGCQPAHLGPIRDEELPQCMRVLYPATATDASFTTALVFRATEIPSFSTGENTPSPGAIEAARAFDDVRASVERFLGRPVLSLEARVYIDPNRGLQRYLITHARIVEAPPPRRVAVPCPMGDGQSVDKFIDEMRGTIAHEVSEATVLSRITRTAVVDPYLRWLHDGIAVLTEYTIEASSIDEGVKKLEKYVKEIEEARARKPRPIWWLDLTRWRQVASTILNSQAFLTGTGAEPLPLNRPDHALKMIRTERVPSEGKNADQVVALDHLAAMVGDSWRKDAMGFSEGEGDPDPNSVDVVLFYHAAFAVWLELERAHPGTLARMLDAIDAIDARRTPIITSDAMIDLLSQVSGENMRPRLLRCDLKRVERVLQEEIARLKARAPRSG